MAKRVEPHGLKTHGSPRCFVGRNPPKHTLLRSLGTSKGTLPAFIHELKTRACASKCASAPTRGFRFSAKGRDELAWMGDELPAKLGVTFQIRLPFRAECKLLKDGKVIKVWQDRETCTHITAEPGVYRVEVMIDYLGRKRTWIISNPIYLRG